MDSEVIAAIIALSGAILSVGISLIISLWTRRYNYNQSMQSIWKNTFYLCYANAIVILNPEFDDFDEYINTTMIKIAGGIYPLTKFVRSDYDLQDYRNVN